MADPSGALLGVNTRDSLDAVIALAHRESPSPDLILATGDIAQDGSEAAYQAFAHRLESFNCPTAWLPGNHDDVDVLNSVIQGTESALRQRVMGGWHFIQLDSSVRGKVHGELTENELAFLTSALTGEPDLPTVILLHHHPVDIGCGWMAEIGLRNRQAFWQVVDRFAQVKIVLWGHIHQEYEGLRKDVRLLATPSTCIQFERGSRQFSVEALAPGYRWFNFFPSGEFETGIHRAEDFVYDLDADSTGY